MLLQIWFTGYFREPITEIYNKKQKYNVENTQTITEKNINNYNNDDYV